MKHKLKWCEKVGVGKFGLVKVEEKEVIGKLSLDVGVLSVLSRLLGTVE